MLLQQLQLLLLVLRPCRVLELVLMLVLVLVLRPGLLLLLLLRLLILLHIGIVIGIVVIGAGIGIVMSSTTATGRLAAGCLATGLAVGCLPAPRHPNEVHHARRRHTWLGLGLGLRVSAIAAAHGLNVSAPTTTGFHDARLVAQLDHPVCLGGGPHREDTSSSAVVGTWRCLRILAGPHSSTGSSENSARDSGAHDRNGFFATNFILFARVGESPLYKRK